MNISWITVDWIDNNEYRSGKTIRPHLPPVPPPPLLLFLFPPPPPPPPLSRRGYDVSFLIGVYVARAQRAIQHIINIRWWIFNIGVPPDSFYRTPLRSSPPSTSSVYIHFVVDVSSQQSVCIIIRYIRDELYTRCVAPTTKHSALVSTVASFYPFFFIYLSIYLFIYLFIFGSSHSNQKAKKKKYIEMRGRSWSRRCRIASGEGGSGRIESLRRAATATLFELNWNRGGRMKSWWKFWLGPWCPFLCAIRTIRIRNRAADVEDWIAAEKRQGEERQGEVN